MANLIQFASQVHNARQTGQRVPGLPAVAGQRSPRAGSTTTNLTVPADVANVANQPSMKVHRMKNGGAATVIERRTRYPNLLDEQDLKGLRAWATRAVAQQINQSQGTLTKKMLRRMGHPYGRNVSGQMRGKLGRIGRVKGARGTVPNLAIVNRQSGEFARSWESDVQLHPHGVSIALINSAPYAAFLAMGTAKSQAHGPWTHTTVSMLSQLNSEWQRVVSQAYRRKAVEQQAATMFGG